MNKNLKLNIFYIALILVFKEIVYMILDMSILKNSLLIQILAYSLSIVAVFLLRIIFDRKQFDFKKIISKSREALVLNIDNLKIILFSFGLLCLSQLFVNLLETIFAFKFTHPSFNFTSINIQNIICICLVPAICEEFLYRGIIISSLSKYNIILSIFLSSFLFGIAHSYTGQALSAFLGGLVYSYLFIKTDSLFSSMILHFINNFLSLIFAYLYSKYSIEIITPCLLSFLIVFAVTALFIYVKSKPKKYIISNQNLISLKESIITTISSICMDIYVIWRIGVIFY